MTTTEHEETPAENAAGWLREALDDVGEAYSAGNADSKAATALPGLEDRLSDITHAITELVNALEAVGTAARDTWGETQRLAEAHNEGTPE